MNDLLYCLNAVIPIFAVIFLGYVLRRKQFFSEGFAASLDRLSFRILLPLLLFRDISAGNIRELVDWRFMLYCAGTTFIAFLVIWALAARFLGDKGMVGAFTQGAFRSSQAVLGVAFAQSLYGDSGYMPLLIIATVPLYNVLAVILLTVTGPKASPFHILSRTLASIVSNPLIWGIVLGMLASLLGWQLPAPASSTVNMLASCATPLALMSIGIAFDGRQAIRKVKPTIWAAAVKLLILPAIFLPIACALGFRGRAVAALLVLYGAPTTVTSFVMAKNMGGDAVLSASIVMLTTAASVLTLTGILYVLRVTGML